MATNEMTLSTTDRPPSLPGAVPRDSSRAGLIVVVVLVFLIQVSFVIGTATLVSRITRDDRTEVFQTSQRFLVLLTTYNASTLSQQRERVLAMAVGKFRDDYSTLTDAAFLKALQDRQADSKGRVVKLAVTSIDGDNAEAFALVEVTTKNKDLPTPRVEENAIELSLVKTGAGWRVDAVSILGRLVRS